MLPSTSRNEAVLPKIYWGFVPMVPDRSRSSSTSVPVLLMVRRLEHGGCERDAAKIVAGLDRTRFEPHFAVLMEGGFRTAEVQKAGVPILNLSVTSFKNLSAIEGIRRMRSYVRKHGIQLVHTFDVPTDIFGAMASRICGVPVVVTSQLSFRELYPLTSRILLRIADWLSRAVVVNSRAVGEALKRGNGVPANKIFLSYNGVDPTHFFPGSGIQDTLLENAAIVVGSVCVMRPEKRIDWIIRAFDVVRQKNPGIRLVLVGSGPQVTQLKLLRDQLGLQESCHFEPSQADVAPWMRSMDVYINSSISESFPNGLLEAMACGCCVIGPKVGGIPELITDLEDGLTFDSGRIEDLADRLSLVVQDSRLRQRLRNRAVRTAHDRFSIQLAIARTESLYERLLARHGFQPAHGKVEAPVG